MFHIATHSTPVAEPARRPHTGRVKNASLLFVCALVASAPAQQPNIVFLFSDDHAYQAISAYGSRVNRTPHIDRLAAEGALFLNSFCGNSICAPSRATVLTGKHSHANGKRTNLDRFDMTQPTFPKLLRKAGYQTALIGKWHLRADPLGFDYWEVLRGQGNYYNPDFRSKDGQRRIEGYATDITTDLALKWLEKRDTKKPFLLMCQHKAPHRTWAPAARHLDLYADRDLPEPATLFDEWKDRSPLLAKNEMSIRDYFYWDYDLKIRDSGMPNPFDRALKSPEYRRMTEAQRKAWDAAYGPRNAAFLQEKPTGKALVRWKYQRYIKDYLRCVTAVDENVGRVLDWLERNGLADDTIVVYASDQGFYLGEHGWYDKRWMFEESLRMPLLVRWPKHVRPGTRVDGLVQNIDYAPTFLEAAGVAVPSDVQGKSLVPILTGEPRGPWRDAVYYAYYEEGEHRVPRHDGVRTRRHKIMYFPTTREWQLFDLEQDPHEMRTVHADPAYAGVLADMQKRLQDERVRFGAYPWPLPGDETVGGHRCLPRKLHGFTVNVQRSLLSTAVGKRTLHLLAQKLADVANVVPERPLAGMRGVPIWLTEDHALKNAQYHPSPRWLRDHGYDEKLARSVHIPRAAGFLALLESHHQPWVVLHELAHAYHHRVLGFDHAGIRAAFEAARDAKLYTSVLHVSGQKRRHYALTNEKEFFAEMTEAYLGTNDFFPFVRAELRKVDPKTFALMKKIWGR